MTFEELIGKIDHEIAQKKLADKNLWFDIDVEIGGIKDRLLKYYKEHGYTIELALCKSCLGQKADITIMWNKG
jgi:hypothetical protein